MERIPTAVIEWNGAVIVQRRPRGGLLAGMWEFPPAHTVSVAEKTLIPVGTVSHAFTHKRIDYDVLHARIALDDSRFTPVPELKNLPFSTAQRRIAQLALPAADL